MDKAKGHAEPVEGGIVPTRYESDPHANQVGMSDAEALTTEVPVEVAAESAAARDAQPHRES